MFPRKEVALTLRIACLLRLQEAAQVGIDLAAADLEASLPFLAFLYVVGSDLTFSQLSLPPHPSPFPPGTHIAMRPEAAGSYCQALNRLTDCACGSVESIAAVLLDSTTLQVSLFD